MMDVEKSGILRTISLMLIMVLLCQFETASKLNLVNR